MILASILKLFSRPFVDYGCYKTYIHLIDNEEFKISKHKVYDIMKKNKLLRLQHTESSKKNKRNRVIDLIPKVTGPLSYFEIDIKFMWISAKKRNAQMLTIIDVESRIILGQYIDYQIKKENVLRFINAVIEEFELPTNFMLRSDNGSQFVANIVQHQLSQKGIIQEFTKPATPQQDAHIEAFHSIVERAICQRFEFKDLNDLRKNMADFINFYNFERIHSGTKYKSPYKNFLQKEEAKIAPSLVKRTMIVLQQKYENYLKNVS